MIDAHVVVVGAGGLSHPASRTLALSGIRRITIIDDDQVDLTNLHRQVLFEQHDVGRAKAPCAAEKLRALAPDLEVNAIEARVVPHTATELLRDADVVVEGADNFATKFLTADACALLHVPLVQAGIVRWSGWALACRNVEAPHATCLRCVFEDIPKDRVETCAEAGVVGPAVGVMGALEAHLALQMLQSKPVDGQLWSYRALAGTLRRTHVRARADCPHARGEIHDLQPERYVAHCAA